MKPVEILKVWPMAIPMRQPIKMVLFWGWTYIRLVLWVVWDEVFESYKMHEVIISVGGGMHRCFKWPKLTGVGTYYFNKRHISYFAIIDKKEGRRDDGINLKEKETQKTSIYCLLIDDDTTWSLILLSLSLAIIELETINQSIVTNNKPSDLRYSIQVPYLI
jgi:hypothetical protein